MIVGIIIYLKNPMSSIEFNSDLEIIFNENQHIIRLYALFLIIPSVGNYFAFYLVTKKTIKMFIKINKNMEDVMKSNSYLTDKDLHETRSRKFDSNLSKLSSKNSNGYSLDEYLLSDISDDYDYENEDESKKKNEKE
jgi:hypothetical protein